MEYISILRLKLNKIYFILESKLTEKDYSEDKLTKIINEEYSNENNILD